MPRPPCQLHRSLQIAPPLPQHARQLHQRRIAGRVVADADVPTVVMPVHQHVFLRLLCARNGRHRHLLHEPAFQHLGDDGCLAAAIGQRHQHAPVGIVHRHHGDLRLARQIGQIRASPDRRARSPVDVDTGIDRDQPDAAPLLDQRRQRRIAEARDDRNPAADHVLRLLDRADRSAEQRGDVAIVAAQRMWIGLQPHQLRGASPRHGQRRRWRLGTDRPALGAHLGAQRDRETDFRLVHLDRHARAAQALHDDVGGAVHILRHPARHRCECLDQAPWQVEADRVQEAAFGIAERHGGNPPMANGAAGDATPLPHLLSAHRPTSGLSDPSAPRTLARLGGNKTTTGSAP